MDRRKAARLLFQLPNNCRVYTAINPAAQWGWLESFANQTNYLLELKLWQDTQVKKGGKAMHERLRPKPFVPDFMKSKEPSPISKGAQVMTVDDTKGWLALPRVV